MRTPAAQLVIPRLDWSAGRGFDASREIRDRALELGVGGFVLGPAPQDDVRALTKELRARAPHTMLIAADLERGAGQLFAGATGLPPLAAIAALGDADIVRKAARLTAREARTLGVSWALAPVLDLDLLADNPVVGSRALGDDPAGVARLGAAWIEACQQEGVLACAKHFPGHGRTATDPQLELPVVRATRRELMDGDLVPFKAAIRAGVASVMVGHVAYPSLDPGGPNVPATLSTSIVRVLLRERLGFEGLVITDAIGKRAVGRPEGEAATWAVAAGCDLVFMPTDLDEVVHALHAALDDGTLDEELVLRSQRRRQKWAQWASPPNDWRKASTYDVASGTELAERVVHPIRGEPRIERVVDLVVVDDDEGRASAPPRDAFAGALRAAGLQTPVELSAEPAPRIVALFGDVLGGKGRTGYSPETIARVRAALSEAKAAGRPATLVQFGHPRLAPRVDADAIVTAWCGDRAMQEAAARWLARRA